MSGHTYGCSICKKEKNENNFSFIHTSFGIIRRKKCKNCEVKLEARQKQNYRNSTSRSRIKLFNLMGGKCACCGLSVWWNLTIDHIKPLNGKSREDSKSTMFKLLKYPELRKDFQIMCFGCNNSKHTGEKCMLEHDLNKLYGF